MSGGAGAANGDANFAATLATRARAHPHATALIEPHGRGGWRAIGYEALHDLAARYASGFARFGIGAGDRALYLLRPSIRGYAAWYALLRLRAVPVLVDPRMGLRALLACVEETRPVALLGVPAAHVLSVVARRSFAGLRTRVTDGRRWLWGGARLADCAVSGTPAPVPATSDGDESILPYTSGSTGPAKGVAYTHGMLRHQAAIMPAVCGWREGMKVVMCYAPFVPYALADGLTAILPDIDVTRPAAAPPRRIAAAVNDHGAEVAFASPIIWMRLARPGARRGHAMPTLERAVTAGAPAPAWLHRRLAPLLHPHGRLYTPYGATEAMPVTTTHTGDLAATWEAGRRGAGTCVGAPLPGVDVWAIRVCDAPLPDWSDALCAGTGEIGEIVVGGPIVSPSYPLRPDETARAKIRRDGRVLHRTGDLGRLDADGRLWFCGRKEHRIETRTGMIAPVAAEGVFNDHPAVFRTALVGVGPREGGAQLPVLCVELEPGGRFTPRLAGDLLALARGTPFDGVVRHMLPHRGFPVDARHNSKIRRDELARWATRVLARRGDA